jgi:hypothetical protein
MKRSLEERKEIVTVVRSKTSVVAWVTENGVIIYDPSETKLTVLVGANISFFDGVDDRMMKAGVDVPLVIVEGIVGLAATDPEWDGQEMFCCHNPDCPDPVRSVDETCYLNLWKRSRKLMN